MKTVYQTPVGVEAHMILHLLQGAGIEGQVLGEHLQGGVGELPAAGLVRVVVEEAQEARARGLIADWERLQPPASTSPGASRRSLATTAFLVGAAVGGFVVWWALRTPVGP